MKFSFTHASTAIKTLVRSVTDVFIVAVIIYEYEVAVVKLVIDLQFQ